MARTRWGSPSSCRPDVMLLDIGMPKLNGYEVCRRLRESDWGRKITVIALTGWGQPQDRRMTTAAGFNLHLVKPADPVKLLRMLGRLESSAAFGLGASRPPESCRTRRPFRRSAPRRRRAR